MVTNFTVHLFLSVHKFRWRYSCMRTCWLKMVIVCDRRKKKHWLHSSMVTRNREIDYNNYITFLFVTNDRIKAFYRRLKLGDVAIFFLFVFVSRTLNATVSACGCKNACYLPSKLYFPECRDICLVSDHIYADISAISKCTPIWVQ